MFLRMDDTSSQRREFPVPGECGRHPRLDSPQRPAGAIGEPQNGGAAGPLCHARRTRGYRGRVGLFDVGGRS